MHGRYSFLKVKNQKTEQYTSYCSAFCVYKIMQYLNIL
jgi:hypothetical protein